MIADILPPQVAAAEEFGDLPDVWLFPDEEAGLLGGINAVIVGNYLTTLGRDPGEDLALLADLRMPVKSLSAAL